MTLLLKKKKKTIRDPTKLPGIASMGVITCNAKLKKKEKRNTKVSLVTVASSAERSSVFVPNVFHTGVCVYTQKRAVNNIIAMLPLCL